MALAAALIPAAIAALTYGAKNDRADRERQTAINQAHDQRLAEREAQVLGRLGGNSGQARRAMYDREAEAFESAVANTPKAVDWVPVVNALGQGAAAIYDEASQPSAPKASGPAGADIPGQNFSAAENYTPPVDVSTWQPVEHRGGFIGDAARRFEEQDKASLPAWLR